MAKETRIGLAVIALLLIVFGAVLIVKMRDDPQTAEAEAGDDDVTKDAAEDDAAGDDAAAVDDVDAEEEEEEDDEPALVSDGEEPASPSSKNPSTKPGASGVNRDGSRTTTPPTNPAGGNRFGTPSSGAKKLESPVKTKNGATPPGSTAGKAAPGSTSGKAGSPIRRVGAEVPAKELEDVDDDDDDGSVARPTDRNRNGTATSPANVKKNGVGAAGAKTAGTVANGENSARKTPPAGSTGSGKKNPTPPLNSTPSPVRSTASPSKDTKGSPLNRGNSTPTAPGKSRIDSNAEDDKTADDDDSEESEDKEPRDGLEIDEENAEESDEESDLLETDDEDDEEADGDAEASDAKAKIDSKEKPVGNSRVNPRAADPKSTVRDRTAASDRFNINNKSKEPSSRNVADDRRSTASATRRLDEAEEDPSDTDSEDADATDSDETKANSEDAYEVSKGETFASIARDLYDSEKHASEKYAEPLWQYNRAKYPKMTGLRAGDVIEAPRAEVLEKKYPEAFRGASVASGNRPKSNTTGAAKTTGAGPRPTGKSNGSTAPRRTDVESAADTREERSRGVGSSRKRTYIVQEGDTLFDIARNELGSAVRWAELHKLNVDVLGEEFTSLEAGIELILPDDEPAPARNAAGASRRPK